MQFCYESTCFHLKIYIPKIKVSMGNERKHIFEILGYLSFTSM